MSLKFVGFFALAVGLGFGCRNSRGFNQENGAGVEQVGQPGGSAPSFGSLVETYGSYSACTGTMHQRASSATTVRGMLQARSTERVPSQRFNDMTFSRPAAGGMGHKFYVGDSPITRYPHEGFDYGASTNSDVRSITSGVVAFVMDFCNSEGILCGDGWGNHVIVDHGGNVFSRYSHLTKVDVKIGQVLQPGDRVGGAGTTGWSDGVHLHMEIGTLSAGKTVERCKPTFFGMVWDPGHYLGARGEIPTLTKQKLKEMAVGKVCPVRSTRSEAGVLVLDGKSNVRDANGNVIAVLARGFGVKIRGWQEEKASVEFSGSPNAVFGAQVGKPAFIDLSQLDLGACH